jgi:ABC-type Fe3+-citrate transport system substrate-binding protein
MEKKGWDNYKNPSTSDKMDKYLGKPKEPKDTFDKTLKNAADMADKKQKENEKMMGESEDTVGTMGLTNSAYSSFVGNMGQQPLKVGRSSPSMARRQRSWNLGFVSDVLEAEGLMTGDLRRQIQLALVKLG